MLKRVLKGIGIGIGALVGLVLVVAVGAAFVGGRHLAPRQVAVQPVSLPAAEASVVAEGRRLVGFYTCQACHGNDLGGQVMADVPPFRVVAPNLTRGTGGIGRVFTDEDWVRALHHGVGRDGRPLVIMPSELYTNLNARDLGALVAYLKQLPPVDRELPKTEVKAIGRIMLAFAAEDLLAAERIAHEAPIPAGLERAPTPAYGAYIASTYCMLCHGEDLHGGTAPEPGSPPAPDLAAAGAWPREAFTRALRTGVTPDGRQLDARTMPWTHTRYLTDVEIEALHRHLQAMPPAAAMAGNRP